MSTATTVAGGLPPARRTRAVAPRAIRETLLLAARSIRTIPRVPERLIDVTLQPVMFILLFVYVFGSAIHVPGTDYKDFLFPGILVQTLAFATIGTATATATDMHDGIVDRFRSLPITRISVLAGQVLGQMFENALGVIVTAGFGLAIGWSPAMGVGDILIALTLVFGMLVAGAAAGVLLGVSVKTPDGAQGIGFLILMPLTFMSGVFVPTEGMAVIPRWIGEWNPIAPIVAEMRDLMGGAAATGAWPLEHPLLASWIWIVIILAICTPIGLRRFAKVTSN